MSEIDGQLYIRFLNDDSEEALRILFEKYKSSLTMFLYGIVGNEDDAEELMMDTFAVLVSKTAHYSVRKDAEFKTWLFAVARNQARNHLRRRKRFFDMTDDALESQPDDFQNQPEYVILREEKNQKLWQALKVINSDYRQVLYLMYFEDMQLDEIARIMKKTKKQVYNLSARAKASLKKTLEEIGYK